jgi:uncharacterized membrane protein YccF (DUF307 family)
MCRFYHFSWFLGFWRLILYASSSLIIVSILFRPVAQTQLRNIGLTPMGSRVYDHSDSAIYYFDIGVH